MKYRLQIQSGPYISLSCDAWAEHTDGNGSMQIKLFNPAMAQMSVHGTIDLWPDAMSGLLFR
jgi:hypothetical protein